MRKNGRSRASHGSFFEKRISAKRRQIDDRELYPALLLTLAVGAAALALWRGPLERPALPACVFFTRWHIYCPACGGTRAAEALLRGRVFQSLYWNPAVPLGAAWTAVYLVSQSVWRLRGRRGWVLRYQERWLWAMCLLLAGNCAVRNALWLFRGVPL